MRLLWMSLPQCQRTLALERKHGLYLGATTRRAATLLTRNPRLFCNVIVGKLKTRRRIPPVPVMRRINGVLFECGGDRDAPLYYGSYAPLVTHAITRFLKPGDVFFDVGANAGYISAIAAGLVGPRGQVHAFEPVPEHFARLQRLAELNPGHGIFANACAASDFDASRMMHIAHQAGQSTLLDSYQRPEEIVRCETIRTVRLDSYIEQAAIERVSLFKIDVEGYELPVLKGLERYFRRTGHRPPLICEIAPRAYPLLGVTLCELAEYMTRLGYVARDLANGTSAVDVRALKCVDDVLFLAQGAS